MLLKRFYDAKLAQASYLIGCQTTGEALVVDANREIDQYLDAARAEGVRVTHVTETHIHADFVSGSRDLARRSKAELLLSDMGDADWKYDFAAAEGARLLRDGDTVRVGTISVDVVHTPGHTPEHLSFVVTDRPATANPMCALTGDFIFVGDVGRPDLLERAAGVEGTMVAGAKALFRSIRRFRTFPDYLQLWPGHGAGSACGKALGAVPSTTLGYERFANWALGIEDEEAFVEAVLTDQPEPPAYFAMMKRINKQGPEPMRPFSRPEPLPPARLGELLNEGARIIDLRPTAAFANAHIPGTISIPLNKSFTTWAGSLIPYDAPFYLIAGGEPGTIDMAMRDLAMIGLDRAAGWFEADVLHAWTSAGHSLSSTRQMDTAELSGALASGATVIDVRGSSEWKTGHIPGVPNIPLGSLAEHMTTLPRTVPIIVHCQSGSRSSIAASLLEAAGFQAATNVAGGIVAWAASGRPVEKG